MNCKTITHWDGVLHILRNPHGFSEDVIRQARLDAADYIEAHGRRDATPSVSAAPPGKCPMCGTPATFEIRLPDGTAIPAANLIEANKLLREHQRQWPNEDLSITTKRARNSRSVESPRRASRR